jgi:hypothetical protein
MDESSVPVPHVAPMTVNRFCNFVTELKSIADLHALLDTLSAEERRALCAAADSHGLSALERACMNSNTDAVRVLIDRCDAPANASPSLASTALHRAAWGGKLAIVQILVDHAADVNAVEDNSNESPIFHAAKNGHAPVVRCLLEHGARVDASNREFCSVLRMANIANHVDCVSALFAAGADSHRIDQRCVDWSRPYTTGASPQARSSHTAAVVQGALLIAGGDTVESSAQSVFQLDLNSSFKPFDKHSAAVSLSFAGSVPLPAKSDTPAATAADSVPAEPKRFPSHFVADPKYNHVLSVQGTRLEYTFAGDVGLGVALGDVPLVANATADIAYFEVAVQCAGRRNFIAVGVVDPVRVPVDKLPGWFEGSVAFHGDDGKKYVGLPYGQLFGPKFTTGDTVGVGVNLARGEVFFTLNGAFIGVAHRLRRAGALHAAVGLYSFGELVEVNFGERPFEFEFQTDQLVWSVPLLTNDVPPHQLRGMRLVSLGDSALLFGSTLAHSYRLTGSAARRRWQFAVQLLAPPPEAERVSHELTEYCVDAAGDVYALVHARHEPLMVLKLVNESRPMFMMSRTFGDERNEWTQMSQGGWDVVEVAEDSPLVPPTVAGASFVAIGDGLLAVLGGRNWPTSTTTANTANTANSDEAELPSLADIVRKATYFFDLRHRHWLGVDQIVNGEGGQSEAIEALSQIGMGHVVAPLGGQSCGALLFGGWDGRRQRSDFFVMTVERVPVDVRRDHLRVVVAAPHSTGTSPVPRNRLTLNALGDGRFVMCFGWDGSKRNSDVDIGVLRVNTSLQTRLLRALDTGAFADTTLKCDDGKQFAVHALVLKRRCSALGAMLDAPAAPVSVRHVASAHLALLLHFAYGDVLPNSTSLSSSEVRSFLTDCVARLAPEHSARLTELLVSIRLATPSAFASDMADAYHVYDAADVDAAPAGESDARLLLSDTRVALVHRAVLTSGSAYFRGCFESMLSNPSHRTIDTSEDDAALVVALLEHLYRGECEFDEDLGGRVVELLSVACKYGCDELADRCESLMLPLVDASNARWLLAHANSLARPSLARQCRDVLARVTGEQLPSDGSGDRTEQTLLLQEVAAASVAAYRYEEDDNDWIDDGEDEDDN